MLTAIEHGSVGPKRMAKAISESKAVFFKVKEKVDLFSLVKENTKTTTIPPHDSKGNKVNIP